MGFADWVRSIFQNAAATPADIRKLSAANETALAGSIGNLPLGERGWIALPEAAFLFSTQRTQYAFGEMDHEGKRRLDEFAAKCKCEVQFVPTEGRVYFRRESHH
jgi:hypothetical protein